MNYQSIKSICSPLEQASMALMSALYDPEIKDSVDLDEVRDALSDGQIVSKRWLLNSVRNMTPRNILVVGGWYGLLAYGLARTFPEAKVTSLDLDQRVTKVARRVLGSLGEAIEGDMLSVSYEPYDLIINTSTEHLFNIREWTAAIPPGCAVAAQNNNDWQIPDHVSCHETHQSFQMAMELSSVLYSNELVFPQYTRFMVVGKK